MVIIFDLDGTLLDSYPLIRQNFVDVFNTYLPNHRYTESLLESFFGPTLIDSFLRVVHDEELAKKLILKYREFSIKNTPSFLRAFPDAQASLKALKDRGYHLAVCSNKVKEAIKEGLLIGELDAYIDYIVGFDDVKKPKPDPEGVKIILNHFQEPGVFVGDSPVDMETGKNAHLPTIGVTWALFQKPELIKSGANYIAHQFKDLIKIVEEIHV
ncbi:MAG: HAD family hydrolase [Bacilli bacterium]